MTTDHSHRERLGHKLAKQLRADAKDCERLLWACLRRKQFAGLCFRRQQPIGRYVADFYCSAAKLVIELDGSQHGTRENVVHDTERDAWLNAQGYRVLRFSNEMFLKDRGSVLDTIELAIQDSAVPLPEPPSAVRPSLKGRVV